MLVRGPLVICREARCAWIDGQPMSLTPQQFDILLRLAEGDGRLLSHAELLGLENAVRYCDVSAVVYAQIAEVRKRLGPFKSMIRTVHGMGYHLSPVRLPPTGEVPPGPTNAATR